jgi:hypothetical protein
LGGREEVEREEVEEESMEEEEIYSSARKHRFRTIVKILVYGDQFNKSEFGIVRILQ